MSPKTKQEGKATAVKEQPSTVNMQVRREADGIHIIFPEVVPKEDNSESIFPDIINEVAPDTYGLDYNHYLSFARLPEIEDPDERIRIVTKLAEAGLVSKENIPTVALVVDRGDEKPAQDKEDPSEKGIQAEAPTHENIINETSSTEIHPEPEPDPIHVPIMAIEPNPEEAPIQLPPVAEKEQNQDSRPKQVTQQESEKDSTEDDFANHEFKF